jgi:nucleoside-diphosphate-sugar epimerase
VPLVKALLAAGFQVSVLTRATSTATFPSYVNILSVDYESIESLTTALKGQDALISCLASLAIELDNNLIEAAVTAGVKRFIPAHYTANIRNKNSIQLPMAKLITPIQERLFEKAKEKNGMTYSLVFTGGFLEMNLAGGLLGNIKTGKVTLYDGGDRVVNLTTIGTIAKGLVAVLQNFEETKNRSVFMSEAALTQNEVIAMAKEIDPNKSWEINHADTTELARQAIEASKLSNPPMMSMMGSVFRMYFGGPDYGQYFLVLSIGQFLCCSC